MNRTKLLFLSVFAALAVVAIGATSASASTKEGHFYRGGVKLAEGKREKVTSKGGVFKLESSPSLECKNVTDKGWVENPAGGGNGKDEAESITFTGCTVINGAACSVTDVVTKEAGKILVSNIPTEVLKLSSGAFGELFTGPKAEETFVELSITGAECAAKGKYKVKGRTVALANGNKLEFTNPAQEGSTLKLGTNEAKLVGTDEQVYEGTTEGVTIGA
jgi:hypothetical protein